MRNRFIFFLALAFFWLLGPEAFGMPPSFEVLSTYTDPRGHVGAQEIIWLYERQGKKITVRDKNEAVGTTVFLYPDDRGRLREAQVVLAIRGKDRVLNFSFDPEKPALVPDSLPPADFLNVFLDPGDWPREYSVREEVAGVAFASTLRLIREELTFDQAMDEGFIRSEDSHRFDDQMFWVYRVINVSAGPEEEEILMQVWPKNGSYWIFEAASHRSSHFIFKD